MSRSHPLTLILCFLLSIALTIGHGVWSLPMAAATDSTVVLAQLSAQQRGRQRYEAGRFAEAVAIWQQALVTLEGQGDVINQASLLSNLALAYQQLGDWGQAEAAIAQSLALLRPIEPGVSTPAAAVFAQVWNTQGNLALVRSQPTQALDSFEKATHYYQQADNPSGILRSQINQAQALQSLGFYRRALTQLSTLSPSLADQPDAHLKATGLQLLGDLQRLTGDLDTAHATLSVGLTTAQTLGDHDTVATVHLSLGHTAQAQQALAMALDHYQQATLLAETPDLRLRAQLSQWSLLHDMENTAAAKMLYQTIQAELTTLPVSRVTVNARLELARQQLKRMVDATQVVQELAIARQQAIELNDPRAESYALGYLGELYQQRSQWRDAQHLLQQALALADTINAPDLAYQWHWHMGQLHHMQSQHAQALASYEKAANNLKSLRDNLIAISPDLRFDFREQVEPFYRGWVDLLLTAAQSSPENSQSYLAKARQAIESLQLAELENFFQEPCVPVSQQIDQVIDNAESPTAVFYPIILPDRLEIILKLPQQPLQHYTTPVAQADLETLLGDLQDHLPSFSRINEVRAEASQLYDWLISPAEASLADNHIDTLVFVLDGFLRSIPMAVLYDGQRYLVENYGIALAPGLQLVDPQPLQRRELATIVAGLSEARHGFAELSSVKDEIDQIQQTIPSHVLFNESFTAENLETIINTVPFPLVHFATHGQFSSDPNQTFVLAWDKRIEMNDLNRLLRQGEKKRQSAVELLILNACETAVGDKRAALGLAGVAVQAGARSTLASLWNLDDKSGAIFSNLFYQELQTPNISKAQALRNTQLKFLQSANTIYQAPRSWAPYVLLGNWL